MDRKNYFLLPEVQQRLQEAIAESNLTMYQIAKNLGLSPSTISNYLSGSVKKPNRDKLSAVCRELGITLEWLLTGENKISEISPRYTSSNAGDSKDYGELLHQLAISFKSRDDQILYLLQQNEDLKKELHDLQKKIKKLTRK